MIRRVAWVAMMGLAISACTGADEPGTGLIAEGSTVNASHEPVSIELCEAFFDRRSAMVGPALESLVPLDREQLEVRQLQRADLDAALEVAANGTTLSDEISVVAENQRVVDELTLQEWGDDGAELLARAEAWDGPIQWYVVRAEVEVLGRTSNYTSYSEARSEMSDALSEECDAPKLGWSDVEDRPPSDVPADLQYLYVSRIDERLALMAGNAAGRTIRVSTPNDALQFTNPVVSPDGQRFFAIGFEDGPSGLFVGPLDDPAALEQVSPPGVSWRCPSWLSDSSGIVIERRIDVALWETSVYDLRSEQTSDFVDGLVPSRDGVCADPFDDTTVLTTERVDETGLAAVWARDAETGTRRQVAAIEGCNTIYPQIRPGTNEVAVITRCRNIYDNGLWIVDLSGGDPRHVLTGIVAAPSWSPAGDWILFGRQTNANDGPELWIADADGLTASKLLDSWASWPTWTPAAT